MAQIAAYLLQKEIVEAPDQIDKYFRQIYEPKKTDPGRQWPPKVSRVVGFERSEFPTFSNVLLHVNGASIKPLRGTHGAGAAAATLVFDEQDSNLSFSVIDGQHRVNGAFLAVRILREDSPNAKWEIPSEIFLDLDELGAPPRRQAQIFIDVNFSTRRKWIDPSWRISFQQHVASVAPLTTRSALRISVASSCWRWDP